MIKYPPKPTDLAERVSRFSASLSLRLYRDMLRIRRIEEAIESRYHENQMKTPIHLVIGQEGSCVGTCAALTREDLAFCGHRTHGVYLAKGGNLKSMMAEFFCKVTGCVGSRGGSMHLLDKSVGLEGTSAICGGIVPIATGAAFTSKYREEGKVISAFFGDGAAEEGVIWESLNFAALKQLPIVYVCENNFFSVCSPLDKRQPKHTSLHKKAKAFGVSSMKVDGTNVLEVYEAMKFLVDKARKHNRPSFLEIEVYRWRAHGGSGDDSKTGYRSLEEGQKWQTLCPIERLGEVLRGQKFLTDAWLAQAEKEIAQEIADAFAFAETSEEPLASDLFRHIYAP